MTEERREWVAETAWSGYQASERLAAEAEAAGDEVRTDVERAESFVLAVVLFATAIALAGIGVRLRLFPVRAAVLAAGWAVFLGDRGLDGDVPGNL